MTTPLDQLQQAVSDLQGVAAEMTSPTDASTVANVVTGVLSVLNQVTPAMFDTEAQAPDVQDVGPGLPGIVVCQVGEKCYEIDVPKIVGLALPKLVGFGKGEFQREISSDLGVREPLETFFVNVMGVVSGLIALFGQVGAIRSRGTVNQYNASNLTTLMSPPDLADAVVRNVLDFDNAANEAAGAGIDRTRFWNMVQLTGEPPGLMQMIELLRRELISVEHFYQAVAYSRVRPEYICDLLNLMYQPMSPADVIEARLKNVITDDAKARKMFQIGGAMVEDYDIALKAAGNAIGIESALTLWKHGLIDEQCVDEVILHSRINPIFEGIAKLQWHKWLSPREIEQALKAGTVKPDVAAEWMMKDGYSKAQADAFVGIAQSTVTKAKGETEAQILQQYQAHLIDDKQATAALTAMGVTAAAIPYLLTSEDAKRAIAAQNRAIERVRAAYLARHITRTKALGELTTLHITEKARAQLLDSWNVERETELRTLTVAQVGSLLKRGFMHPEDAHARWQQMGYSAADADLLQAEYTGVAPAGSPAALMAGSSGL